MNRPQHNQLSDPADMPRHDQPQGHPINPARWLSALPDDLPISEINIPGSHNAAAINMGRRTRWTCQCQSITTQLEKGIRLLDIRLKPKKRRRVPTYQLNDGRTIQPGRAPNSASIVPVYDFVTCHGRLGPFGANEFQPFDEVLEECTAFLKTNPGETIIMSIQIDDWRRTKKQAHPQILKALQARLTHLPLIKPPHIPTLHECRGRIFLINRINDDPALGVPIAIPDNTPGETLPPTSHRHYEVYVQDQYRKLNKRHPGAHNLHLTIAAFEKKRPGVLLLNFASGTKPFGRLIDITKELLYYFNAHPKPQRLGWLLFDYPFTTSRHSSENLAARIIASNLPAS